VQCGNYGKFLTLLTQKFVKATLVLKDKKLLKR